jgi:hypothetical protein
MKIAATIKAIAGTSFARLVSRFNPVHEAKRLVIV